MIDKSVSACYKNSTNMNKKAIIAKALKNIFYEIEKLKKAFPKSGKNFTIDGRLVGDIGEVIAELDYDLRLDDKQQPVHDGKTSDGKRKVQVKATFKDSLTFKTVPDYYLGLQLFKDGRPYKEIFNGPGNLIYKHYQYKKNMKKRKGIGEALLSFPIKELEKLSKKVPKSKRIKKHGS